MLFQTVKALCGVAIDYPSDIPKQPHKKSPHHYVGLPHQAFDILHGSDHHMIHFYAMHLIVKKSLEIFAESENRGDHHFYISFDTTAPGVNLSDRLLEKYPEEMTIVLQHRFWDLFVHDDYFEVKLSGDDYGNYDDIVSIHYHFADWFDHASIKVETNSPVWDFITRYIAYLD